MPIHFHEDDAVCTVAFDGPFEPGEFDAYLRRVEGWMDRGRTYGLIYDLRKGSIPPRAIRVRQGQWLKDHRARLQELDTPVAFVMGSAAMRFVLSSIFALGPMSGAYRVVATVEEARVFIAEVLAARGSTPPDDRAVGS